uniref:Tektin n=1 Tax=Heliothis virescens TaxID=7102 RepID=A0A2A4JA11_HELVI
MFAEPCYLGSFGLEDLRLLNDKLNAEVVEQVNDTQELVMLNNFAHESNEYQFKKCLQDRISDIASWRWVLEDLTKRLTEASGALQYELNALRVVVTRLQNEIEVHSKDGSRPGILSPLSDSVEEAILQEYEFLRDQKKNFEKMIKVVEAQTAAIDKTKKRIAADVLHKERALSVEEACGKVTAAAAQDRDRGEFVQRRCKKKRRASPVTRWERRCVSLKTAGLRALSNAIITRQQVRGARVHLSITAQAYAARVDAALRRRLNINKVKLQDIYWQKEEAIRDYKALEEELTATEQNLLETMDQERIVGIRLADRAQRPPGEHIKDEVDKKLREELGRLRNFIIQLRNNHNRITNLQHHLTECMARVDCCAEDILRVVRLDDNRIVQRLGEAPTELPQPPRMPPNIPPCKTPIPSQTTPVCPDSCACKPDYDESETDLQGTRGHEASLQSIQEEDEDYDDDYPFDD